MNFNREDRKILFMKKMKNEEFCVTRDEILISELFDYLENTFDGNLYFDKGYLSSTYAEYDRCQLYYDYQEKINKIIEEELEVKTLLKENGYKDIDWLNLRREELSDLSKLADYEEEELKEIIDDIMINIISTQAIAGPDKSGNFIAYTESNLVN